ncbi:type II toxin-antitoxin system VapC family toxin [Thermostichus vulcanus]|uniref:Type II toxin-antitoxin system VapC family toxin n=1 Tax=Thermostichus vulcanus str. 'Rupite' TaxID=2813851 RepID=A0ABT0C964_THEVL|nr:type II toxin-antitoxin system VapC family toxin [Thermostichus vulcanus]MCJ2542310.1 type II toxin-antitoxin system VapC family toxin [Thermostichus vulcanus str. 'Rupite']
MDCRVQHQGQHLIVEGACRLRLLTGIPPHRDPEEARLYISVVTLGELRRGIERIRHRGDHRQADLLEAWLQVILDDYADHILDFTVTEAQVWGRLRVPHPQNAIDKQLAATALVYGLTLVTRNVNDFVGTGVPLINPFEPFHNKPR